MVGRWRNARPATGGKKVRLIDQLHFCFASHPYCSCGFP
jgi:hypothetical protein